MSVPSRRPRKIHHGHRIKQKRSQLTYDALIAAGFRLLEKEDLENITVAELAKEAGYSVGAFYARFSSKDQFFDALLQDHLELRTESQKHLFSTCPMESMIHQYIDNMVRYYWGRRNFWREVMKRSMREPEFWDPIREQWFIITNSCIARLTSEIGRPLTEEEEENLSFAFQITLGVVNNTLLEQSGPVMLNQQWCVDHLERVFKLSTGFDQWLASAQKKKKAG